MSVEFPETPLAKGEHRRSSVTYTSCLSLQLLSEEEEQELTILVRYFMSFGSKTGGKTLTLQVGIIAGLKSSHTSGIVVKDNLIPLSCW